MKAWLRDLEITLSSSKMKKSLTFGSNWKVGKNDFDISVSGSKYLSSMKDNFTIKIANITYAELVQLIQGEYYKIEIKAGYRSKGAMTIFSGSVIYMSYEKQNVATNTVIILAGSDLVAKYGQSRMNLSLSSGINMYSALKFICKRAGIQDSNVDESLKNRLVKEVVNVNSTANSWLESFCNSNNFIVNSDGTYNSTSIINPYKTNNRIVKLDSENTVLVSGYPKLTSDGLTMTVLPLFDFMTMDVIEIDNSLIDISADSAESSEYNKSMYFDTDGRYLITQLDYDLNNRHGSYNINIKAKARSLYSKVAKESYK